jgi:hypothetical protein
MAWVRMSRTLLRASNSGRRLRAAPAWVKSKQVEVSSSFHERRALRLIKWT